jgi:hypothetical protein
MRTQIQSQRFKILDVQLETGTSPEYSLLVLEAQKFLLPPSAWGGIPPTMEVDEGIFVLNRH